MSLYGAFDATKHLAELDSPLVTAEGILTPAQRRNRVTANLFAAGSTAAIAGALDIDGTIDMDGAVTAGTPRADFDFTSTSTSGSTSVEGLTVSHTMSGAGGVGGRAKFSMTAEAALGSWSNALKAEVNYAAGGKTTGLGSAFVAELVMGADTDEGTYAPLEIEFGFPDGSDLGTDSALIYMNMYGDTEELAAAQAQTDLFSLNGAAAGTGNMFQTGNTAPTTVGGTLRVKIGDTHYYLILYTSEATTS